MVAWRNSSLCLGVSMYAANALAQGMAPAPAPVPAPAIVAPKTPAMPVVPVLPAPLAENPNIVINKPRLEKPSRAGSLELTALGHSGWLVRTPSGTTLLVDPWIQSPEAPQDLVLPEAVDAILITHGHFDHVGDAQMLSHKLHAPVIASYELAEQLDVDSAIGTNPGGVVAIKDVRIHATTAVHSSGFKLPPPPAHMMHKAGCPCHAHEALLTGSAHAELDPAILGAQHDHEHMHEHEAIAEAHSAMPSKAGGKKHAAPKANGKKDKKAKAEEAKAPSPACENMPVHACTCMPSLDAPQRPHYGNGGVAMGFVIEMDNGPTLYHAGDTDVFADMALIGKRYHPHIALLPIGGKYTMCPQGAALATHLLGVQEVVPMHYGRHSALPGSTPQAFSEALKSHKHTQKVRMTAPSPGARISFLP